MGSILSQANTISAIPQKNGGRMLRIQTKRNYQRAFVTVSIPPQSWKLITTNRQLRNLKQKRLTKGMTQEQLAKKVGVSVNMVERHESGKCGGIRSGIACWYAVDALDIPLQALLTP